MHDHIEIYSDRTKAASILLYLLSCQPNLISPKRSLIPFWEGGQLAILQQLLVTETSAATRYPDFVNMVGSVDTVKRSLADA